MDLTFGSDAVTLGAAISPGDEGYAVLSICITEKNLVETLQDILGVIGMTDLKLCDHVMQNFKDEVSSYLLSIFEARKTFNKGTQNLGNLCDDNPTPKTIH